MSTWFRLDATSVAIPRLAGQIHGILFSIFSDNFPSYSIPWFASFQDGYLRLCGACQAIRKLPDEFFPPFINEVMCDEDKACLYFYNYRMTLSVVQNVCNPKIQLTANASKST
jgi:hypothetical protein